MALFLNLYAYPGSAQKFQTVPLDRTLGPRRNFKQYPLDRTLGPRRNFKQYPWTVPWVRQEMVLKNRTVPLGPYPPDRTISKTVPLGPRRNFKPYPQTVPLGPAKNGPENRTVHRTPYPQTFKNIECSPKTVPPNTGLFLAPKIAFKNRYFSAPAAS